MISEKQRAAEAAVEYVKDGMIVGLGTGSTTEFAVKKLGERVRDGLAIRGIPTSDVTKVQAEEEGIPLIDFSETMYIDLTIDGADEIDINLNMIKGGGAALLREKIVASASKEEIIIVSHEKFVKQLGSFPLPVEVIPFGWQVIFNQLETLGGSPDLRLKQGQPLRTDQGNYIIDCRFRQIIDASQLEQRLNMIPGVVENGLFTGLCTRMIMAEGEKIVVKERGIK
jgi:ribose 5-phosphate isomerase A|tara:strand:+ start:1644 stop:2321 length:678 start_codon:yes stop_codon:yes gene_type:complete